jgi:3-methyladenine DNA glycosylase AlkD
MIINDLCNKNANPIYAEKMKTYMKGHFEFFGISAPLRKDLTSLIKKEISIKSSAQLINIVEDLYHRPERENQYIAIDILRTHVKKLDTSHILTIQSLIVQKSWWDTVDLIVPNIIGDILMRCPNAINDTIIPWIEDNNMWLNRAAIIYQLKYKSKTNLDILSQAILQHDTSKEFFIRKAQGWALREFSKVDPLWVYKFLEANPQLSGLTIREASKYL